MNQLLFLVCLCCCWYACKSIDLERKEVYRFSYVEKGEGSINIQLNNDGTFSYQGGAGLSHAVSEGTWSRKGKDSLILLSDIAYKTGYIVEVVEKQSSKEEAVMQLIDIEYNDPLGFAMVLLGEKDYKKANEQGIISLGQQNYDRFSVHFLSDDLKWEFKDQPKGDLEVRLSLSDHSKLYFDHEVWILKNRKLISPSGTILKYRK